MKVSTFRSLIHLNKVSNHNNYKVHLCYNFSKGESNFEKKGGTINWEDASDGVASMVRDEKDYIEESSFGDADRVKGSPTRMSFERRIFHGNDDTMEDAKMASAEEVKQRSSKENTEYVGNDMLQIFQPVYKANIENETTRDRSDRKPTYTLSETVAPRIATSSNVLLKQFANEVTDLDISTKTPPKSHRTTDSGSTSMPSLIPTTVATLVKRVFSRENKKKDIPKIEGETESENLLTNSPDLSRNVTFISNEKVDKDTKETSPTDDPLDHIDSNDMNEKILQDKILNNTATAELNLHNGAKQAIPATEQTFTKKNVKKLNKDDKAVVISPSLSSKHSKRKTKLFGLARPVQHGPQIRHKTILV